MANHIAMCPGCLRWLSVQTESLGQPGRCPHCGQRFRFPPDLLRKATLLGVVGKSVAMTLFLLLGMSFPAAMIFGFAFAILLILLPRSLEPAAPWIAGTVAGVWFCCILFSLLFHGVWDERREAIQHARRLATTVCRHGVRGGETMMTCKRCPIEAEEARRRQEREDEEARRRHARSQKIAKAAQALERSEVERIKKQSYSQLERLVAIDPSEFEKAVCDLYQADGYDTTLTPAVGDLGFDIRAMRDGRKYLVECKRWGRNLRVGRPVLQKLVAAMLDEHADEGIVVTTAGFSWMPEEYAKSHRIRLIDGESLVRMMRRSFPTDRDADNYSVMCRVCGEMVVFQLHGHRDSLECTNGHVVKNRLLHVLRKDGIV